MDHICFSFRQYARNQYPLRTPAPRRRGASGPLAWDALLIVLPLPVVLHWRSAALGFFATKMQPDRAIVSFVSAPAVPELRSGPFFFVIIRVFYFFLSFSCCFGMSLTVCFHRLVHCVSSNVFPSQWSARACHWRVVVGIPAFHQPSFLLCVQYAPTFVLQ